MHVVVRGSTLLNGFSRSEVTVSDIEPYHEVILMSVSGSMKGVVIVSEILANVGFSLSSSSPDDVGQIVYFDVVESEGAKAKWEARTPPVVIGMQ
jgi:hypothetical protein